MAGKAGHRRLTGSGAFDAVFRQGRRLDGTYLQMISVGAARDIGRIGFVIGRKALPLAVDRNRVRRMLRSVIDQARPALDGVDVIVRLKRGAPRSEFAIIAAEGTRLLRDVARSASPRGSVR